MASKIKMAKSTISISTHAEFENFITVKRQLVPAVQTMLQIAMSNSDIVSACDNLKKNWGDVSYLLADQWAKLESVRERCKVNPRTTKMSPADWSDYMATTKMQALEVFQSVSTFLESLTFEAVSAIVKPTGTRNRADKTATFTINGSEVTPIQLLQTPEFAFALAEGKESLTAYYDKLGATPKARAAMSALVTSIVEFKIPRVRKSKAELQALLDSGKDEKGNELSDDAKVKLAEKISKMPDTPVANPAPAE